MPTCSSVLRIGFCAVLLAGCDSADAGNPLPAPVPASAPQMVHLLETLLPAGRVSAQQGQGVRDPSGPPFAQLAFEQGGKAAQVKVVLDRYSFPVPTHLLLCPDTAYHPYSECTQTQLSSGARLVLDQSPAEEDKPSGGKLRTAVLTHENGMQVFVSETARPDAKTAAGDSALPLTLEQLSAIATSPVWKPVLLAMPEPHAIVRTGAVPMMNGLEISQIIDALLPAGLHVARIGGLDGFGHVTIDDGRGESLVAANVQRWRAGHPSMAQLFERADTLPDGTRITIQQAPPAHGGEGVVEWSVDTLRTNGLRVVISAINAGAYRLPASRREPVLNLQQLRRIALDPAWQRVSD